MTPTMEPAPSFDRIAAELSPDLLRYLQRMVGTPETAEDLLQETLIRIFRGLPDFAARSSAKTWAFAIATRVAVDHFRKPHVRAPVIAMEDERVVPDRGADVEEKVVIDEMNACVRGVIDSLPPEHRAALVLHDLQGMTAAETAEACDCSIATAKIRIHRARKRLQLAMEQACTFYRDRADVLRCDRKSPEGD